MANKIDDIKSQGTIYHDHYSKGYKSGKKVTHDRWCAEIMIERQRYRHRSTSYDECVDWLKAIKMMRIKPGEDYRVWLKAETGRRTHEEVVERVETAAREAMLILEYQTTRSFNKINEYVRESLLPRLIYYALYTLKFNGRETLDVCAHAVAILYTRIDADIPVTNFTGSCRRMLRVRKQHGDFFFYEKMPEKIGIALKDLDLSNLGKVTILKDRRRKQQNTITI